MSKDAFIEAIASTATGRVAAALLWDQLNDCIAWEGLTPYPEDDLGRVYGLAEEELEEDIVLHILEKTGTAVPSRAILQKYGPDYTAADIIRLVEESEYAGHCREE